MILPDEEIPNCAIGVATSDRRRTDDTDNRKLDVAGRVPERRSVTLHLWRYTSGVVRRNAPDRRHGRRHWLT
jgi:hypothetical protein